MMPETVASIVRHFHFRFGSPFYNFADHHWTGAIDKRHKVNEPEDFRRQYIVDMRWVKELVCQTHFLR